MLEREVPPRACPGLSSLPRSSFRRSAVGSAALACAVLVWACRQTETSEHVASTPSASAQLPPLLSVSTPPVVQSSLPSLPDGLLESPLRTVDPVRMNDRTSAECPSDMVLVDGEHCRALVQPCTKWVEGGVRRCIKFEKSRCVVPLERRTFCIDRYEYPNLKDVKPAVMVSWYDALRACSIEGKRLCLQSEWNFACEGVQQYPYPYGFVRNKTVCNFERPRPRPEPRFQLFAEPWHVGDEVRRLDLRVESGRLLGCVSPFGVQDMTGNVDEWVLNEDHFHQQDPERKPPYISGLKGGYWGPIRAACRPVTVAHEERFRFYQVGFRCCKDPASGSDGFAAEYVAKLAPWWNKLAKTPTP